MNESLENKDEYEVFYYDAECSVCSLNHDEKAFDVNAEISMTKQLVEDDYELVDKFDEKAHVKEVNDEYRTITFHPIVLEGSFLNATTEAELHKWLELEKKLIKNGCAIKRTPAFDQKVKELCSGSEK